VEVSELGHQPVAQINERWEARAIRMATLFACGMNAGAAPRDRTGMCVLSIIAHRLSIEDMNFLLRVCGFRGTALPMLTSAARIAKTGHIMANMVASNGVEYRNQALFRDTRQMESAMRRFADLLRLSDAERVDFFDSVKRWVVCDYRIDPNMNPADPDSRRLTVN
jgi:hypothetical protein